MKIANVTKGGVESAGTTRSPGIQDMIGVATRENFSTEIRR